MKAIVGLAILLAAHLALAAENPPNVVIIVADDLGWGDVGYHGSEIATPRLDRLAAEGVVLDRFYAQPSCSPTRAALMTGKTPMRLGVLSPISKNNPAGLPLTERVLDALEAEAMLDSTLIWFLSDNGGLNPGAVSPGLRKMSERLEGWFGKPLPLLFLEFIRTNALEGGADNGPYRKGKQSVYEGGVRVPSLIYWRGHLTPRRISRMLTAQDVLPTLLGAAGLEARAAPYDGADQWPLVARDAAVPTPDYVTQGRDGVAFYRFPWKLVELASGEVELYQIDEDPTEQADRAAAEPSVVEALVDALRAFPRGESVNLPLWKILWDVDFFGGEEDREPWADRVK